MTLPDWGTIDLDLDPDVRLALLLSDALNLDEHTCVHLLLTANNLGDLSAERAAGIWYEDRHAQLLALVTALRFEMVGAEFPHARGRRPVTTLPAHKNPAPNTSRTTQPDPPTLGADDISEPTDLLALVANENVTLTSPKSNNGRLVLVERLLALLHARTTTTSTSTNNGMGTGPGAGGTTASAAPASTNTTTTTHATPPPSTISAVPSSGNTAWTFAESQRLLHSVVDSEGRRVSREALVTREATLAARTLFMISYLRPEHVRGCSVDADDLVQVRPYPNPHRTQTHTHTLPRLPAYPLTCLPAYPLTRTKPYPRPGRGAVYVRRRPRRRP